MSACLFIIDPQRDFLDEPDCSVPVPGAVVDMMNLTDLIYQYGDQLDRIVVTLDQHPHNHIAHADMWIDPHFRHPKPFDQITYSDIMEGRWHSVVPSLEHTQAEYVREAEAAGFGLTIWPHHCIIGSRGAALYPRLSMDLAHWAKPDRHVRFFAQSDNWSTEHASSFRSMVTRPDDGTTWWNDRLWQAIQADTILIAGESLSHGVRQTINDAIAYCPDIITKMIILEDCTSPREGYKVEAQEFLHEFCNKGGRIARSDVIYRHTLDFDDY